MKTVLKVASMYLKDVKMACFFD